MIFSVLSLDLGDKFIVEGTFLIRHWPPALDHQRTYAVHSQIVFVILIAV
jgi:hypothetical protein